MNPYIVHTEGRCKLTTVRQIERFWSSGGFSSMIAHLCADRPEFGVLSGSASRILAAGLAVIRIDEFGQSYQPIASSLIRAILAAQDADGGWGDTVTTVIALRALLASQGNGVAVERAMRWLAQLQKPEGAWPDGPPRRLPADAAATAFVLMHLGQDHRLRTVAKVVDAMQWLETNLEQLDAAGKRLAQRALLRCKAVRAPSATLFAVTA